MSEDNRNYGGFITTYEGRKFFPLDPRVEGVSIHDIAHAHALTCRWTGATRNHYPLAQHCVLVCREARKRGFSGDVQLWGLFHDGSEGYICDLARPVKVEIAGYRSVETRLQDTIVASLGLPPEMPAIIKHLDDVLLCTEARDLTRNQMRGWSAEMTEERLPYRIRAWPMWYAEIAFLREYKRLRPGASVWGPYLRNKWRDFKDSFRPLRLDGTEAT